MSGKQFFGIPWLLLALTLVAAQGPLSQAQLIPANRLIPWTPGVTVGVPGGPQTTRTNSVSVVQFGADPTGVASCYASVVAAINTYPSNGVVFFPPGTYTLPSTITINKSYFTIRGSNATINLTGGAGFASLGTGGDYLWSYPATNCIITGGLTQGSTSLQLANTYGFVPGHIMQIQYYNDATIPVVHVNGYNGLRRQKTMCLSTNNNTLTIFPALYDTTSNIVALAESGYYGGPVFVGIENLTINATNSTSSFVIQIDEGYGCWVKGVHTTQAYNYHIFLYDCLQCEVRECFMDTLNHAGSNGAGLLMNTSSGCLIEDNIIYQCAPLMEINNGSSGNVIGYNFCENSTTYGVVGPGIDCNHGPHNSYNLYEGNVAPNIQSDGYFGSDSREVVYRNLLHATSPGAPAGASIILNRFSRDFTIVGNILGTNGFPTGTYSFGYPNMGNGTFTGYAPPWANWGKAPGPNGFQEMDTGVQASVHVAGNYNYLSNSIPTGESLGSYQLLPSLYLTSKPAWFGSLNWPPFDPTLPNPLPSKASIPAGYLFFNGAITPAGPPPPIILPNSVLVPSPN